ncbi:MAG: hypothetical protein JJE44_09235 [Flavobacteriaceae bacterium]|nr:hypothetical protein [Flavobacteriaceae bacterium]
MKNKDELNIGNHNDEDIEKKWNTIHEEYISKYAELRNEDLSYQKGGINGMFEKIGKKRGKTRIEIRREVSSWR